MKKTVQFLVLTVTLLSQTLLAGVTRSFETGNLPEVQAVVDQAVQKYGAEKVLLVTDLDNTLLETDTDFGSEHWFLWQKSLLESGLSQFPLVGRSIDDVFRVQDIIIYVQGMHPTAAGLPALYQRLKTQGAARMVLTSRSATTRDATLREMDKNAIPLSPQGEMGLSVGVEPFMPYDINNLQASGFSEEERIKLGISSPRAVVYDRGVFLTQGQNKGVMLRSLLVKASRQFDAIIFTDDRQHHVEAMNQAFADQPQELTSIRFTPVIGSIQAFNQGDKTEVNRQWCLLHKTLSGTFPPSTVSGINPCPPSP